MPTLINAQAAVPSLPASPPLDPAASLRAHAKSRRWTIMRQASEGESRHYWVYAQERIAHVHVAPDGRVRVDGPAGPLRDALEDLFT